MSLPAAAKLRIVAGRRSKFQKRQNKSNDQRDLVIKYYRIKEPWPLDIKYYLVT